MERSALSEARVNVSMGLKALQSWCVVRRHEQSGNRRGYFSTLDDTWQIARIVAEERRGRRARSCCGVTFHCQRVHARQIIDGIPS